MEDEASCWGRGLCGARTQCLLPLGFVWVKAPLYIPCSFPGTAGGSAGFPISPDWGSGVGGVILGPRNSATPGPPAHADGLRGREGQGGSSQGSP